MKINIDNETAKLLKVLAEREKKDMNTIVIELIEKAGKEHLKETLLIKYTLGELKLITPH